MTSPPDLIQNLQQWLNSNRSSEKLSLESTHKLMKDDSQIRVYYIGDCDERNYFHMQEAEELYYVFKGELILRCLDCTGVSKDIHIMEGEVFLLPSRILHCVRKCENLSAIMFERERLPNEMDNLSWFVVDNKERPSTSNDNLLATTSYGDNVHNTTLPGHIPGIQLSPPHSFRPAIESVYDDDSDIQRFSVTGDPFVPLTAIKKRSPSVISNAENYHCTAGPRMKLLKETWFHCYNVYTDIPHALEALKGRIVSGTNESESNNKGRNTPTEADHSAIGPTPQSYKPSHDLEDDIHPPIALDLWIERHRPEIHSKGCVSLFDEDDYQVKVMVYGSGEHIGRNNVADIFVWQYAGSCTFSLNNDDDDKSYQLNTNDVAIVPRGTSYTAVNQPNALTLHIVIDPRKKSS